MADIGDKFPSPRGGGTPAYFSGTEVYRDLSSASFDAGSSVSDVGKTVVLYSSTEGKSYKLCNANATGMAVGKACGFRLLPQSKPIKILNQGTGGTDAVLEAFMLPGASCTLFANSIASAKGDWRGGGTGLFHGAVPVVLPCVLDAANDLGDVPAAQPAYSTAPNNTITMLTSTLYVVTWVNAAGTSVKCQAYTYTRSTDTWAKGAIVTSFTSANQWSCPRVIATDATHFSVLAWEATNGKVSARTCSVSGGTITQGTTIVSGGWTVNPSNATSMSICSLIKDSATSFFWATKYDGTHLAVQHFSISGTTLTNDGGTAFGSSAVSTTDGWLGGYSPSANILDFGWCSDNAVTGISRYTYGAGTCPKTFDIRDPLGFGGQGTLQAGDGPNRVYYTGATTNFERYVVNAALNDLTEFQLFNGLYTTALGKQATALTFNSQVLILSDTEALLTQTTTGTMMYLTLVDLAVALRARVNTAASATTDNGTSTKIVAAQMWNGPWINSVALFGMNVDPTTRQGVVMCTSETQSSTTFQFLRAYAFDLPRNYDQAII